MVGARAELKNRLLLKDATPGQSMHNWRIDGSFAARGAYTLYLIALNCAWRRDRNGKESKSRKGR
jgi:hypothetical protein